MPNSRPASSPRIGPALPPPSNLLDGATLPERSLYEIIQRSGEVPEDYYYKSFLATADRPEVADLSVNYPQRWHVEEFFKFNQALGWQRAGTLNLNIRYGHMTLALLAQAVGHQFRQN